MAIEQHPHRIGWETLIVAAERKKDTQNICLSIMDAKKNKTRSKRAKLERKKHQFRCVPAYKKKQMKTKRRVTVVVSSLLARAET